MLLAVIIRGLVELPNSVTLNSEHVVLVQEMIIYVLKSYSLFCQYTTNLVGVCVLAFADLLCDMLTVCTSST